MAFRTLCRTLSEFRPSPWVRRCGQSLAKRASADHRLLRPSLRPRLGCKRSRVQISSVRPFPLTKMPNKSRVLCVSRNSTFVAYVVFFCVFGVVDTMVDTNCLLVFVHLWGGGLDARMKKRVVTRPPSSSWIVRRILRGQTPR